MHKRFLPVSVTNLLSYQWREKEGCTESIANASIDRIKNPSYYFIHSTDTDVSAESSISHAEASALHNDGAFGVGSHLGKNGEVVVNEHAKHSLEEFLGDVTAAWNRHQERLAKFVKEHPEPAS